MAMRSLVSSALVFLLTVGAAAAADTADAPILEVPILEVPLDCGLGAHCVVQNYVDQDPGPGAADHTCGPLSYDGHRGVDFRVAGVAEMPAGVPVLAAAPGLVIVARDGRPDGPARTRQAGTPDSGNAVVIDHGHGWHSQYSHLRRGSLAVGRGERVEAGARLGLIGRSGTAAFAHLHFEIRHRGRAMDPFTGLPAGSGCGRGAAPRWTPLWSPAAQAKLAYRAGGLLAAGFAAAAPSLAGILEAAVLEDGPRRARLAVDTPALVFWAASWGLRAGDRENMRILGPDGRVLVEETGRLPRNQAQWLRHAGAKRRGQAFPPGRYRGEYRVTRETGGHRVTVVSVSRAIELR